MNGSDPSMTGTMTDQPATAPVVAGSGVGRLFEGQTAIDFVGRRKIALAISVLLLVLSVISLFTRGLNLGIDFEGGVSWDVPATEFTIEDATEVLESNDISTEGSRIQRRAAVGDVDLIKVQVGDQPEEIGEQLRAEFAEAAGVAPDEVNVSLVSSSWGSDITNKAVRALVIFLVAVAIFISIRFEWRMAIAAIVAMIHDVVISVGIYSLFQFLVTPATVIAFLTILGYSLYDTIVVFDRVRENESRFAASKPPYADVLNASMNQVLMRSLTTSFSAIVPVISLLLIGAGIMGATALSEFALALLVGMVTGAYSSIFIAAPLLGLLKQTDSMWSANKAPRATGEALREMVTTGAIASRRSRERTVDEDSAAPSKSVKPGVAAADQPDSVAAALRHAPRPRKKTRR